MAVRQLESKISNWATQTKIRCLQQAAITVKHGKDSLDRIRGLCVSRCQHGRFKHFLVPFQHCHQQLLFCPEKVIETAAVHVGSFEDVGDTGGGIAPLEEELARSLNELVPSPGCLY